MSPAEVAAVARLRLAAELDQDREGLRSLASAILRLQHRTDDSDREWLRVRALSFEIERWYTAMEATLERVLRALDGAVPAGPSWHGELLRSAAVPVEGLRPAVISPEAVDALRAIRRVPATGEVVRLAGCDPLNLTGVLSPGSRVAASLGTTVAFRDGVPLDERAPVIGGIGDGALIEAAVA